MKCTKQGFREIKPKLDNDEKIKISLQRYKCKSCNRKYSTKLKNLKKENNSFFESIINKVRKSKFNRGGSLRKIAKDVKNFLNIDVSHQSIKNFLRIDENQVKKEGSRIVRKFNLLSGYLTIDEEYVYIDGKRKYRVSLHDRFIKGPIAEEYNEITAKEKNKRFNRRSYC